MAEESPKHQIIRPGPGRLSAYALDTYVAPELSKLTENPFPDLSGEVRNPDNWIPNFVLNHIFGFRRNEPDNRYVLNLLRRVHAAIRAYGKARELLDEYLERRGEAVSRYLYAVNQFEVVLAGAWQAYQLGKNLAGMHKLYERKQDTAIERLDRMDANSRHFDSQIKGGHAPSSALIPLWITNDGLASSEYRLSADELAGMLVELGSFAELLANPPSGEKEDVKKDD